MIIVKFSDEALKHYGELNLPGVNNVLRMGVLDHALSSGECPLCKEFNEAIMKAITEESSRRLTNTK